MTVQPLPLGVPVPASSMTKERQTLSADGFKAKAKLEPHGELNSCIHIHIWYETYQYLALIVSGLIANNAHQIYTLYQSRLRKCVPYTGFTIKSLKKPKQIVKKRILCNYMNPHQVDI